MEGVDGQLSHSRGEHHPLACCTHNKSNTSRLDIRKLTYLGLFPPTFLIRDLSLPAVSVCCPRACFARYEPAPSSLPGRFQRGCSTRFLVVTARRVEALPALGCD